MDARRKLDRLFRIAAQQTRDYALFLLDASGHIRTWNLGAQRMKGYAPNEIIGQHFSIFYPEDAIRSGWPAYELEMAAKEGRFEDEGWRIRKDRTRFWASVIITALRETNGELLGFSKITRDLTDRMLEQEALRQSEERFRLLVEGVVDYAIYMLDPNGIITSWNLGAERITGYTRGEIIGNHFSRFYPEEGRKAGLPEAELATARATGRAEDEAWRVRKNGELFWARVVVTALHDAQGQLRGFAKVTQDLTQRRHLEDLQKAAASVNEFIATLAHELRNPLAPIRNAAQAMAQLRPSDPAHESMRAMIERQSASLTRIVDDLLDITRITRGNFVIERTLVDIAQVVRDAVEAAAPAIESRQHILEISVPECTMMVIGDAHRLAQIVVNLLNNAARYTAPGGKITVSGEIRDGSAVLRVQDTGQGIAPELIGRIFDMFVQGRNQLERIGGGLGIGLALARNIAELHGGSIDAKSEGLGRGAEFIVRLPLADHAAGALARSDVSHGTAAPAATPKRVLVVDDNADAAMALDLLVRSLGHETRVANDGARAIEMAAEFHPQVVLLDIGMPGINGYEVAKQIRAASTSSPVRIVAVTGWGQENDRQRSMEAGFDLHLVKPVTPDQISLLIEQANGATFH